MIAKAVAEIVGTKFGHGFGSSFWSVGRRSGCLRLCVSSFGAGRMLGGF